MCSCLKFFSTNDWGTEKFPSELDEKYPDFVCETEKCSDQSPGVVRDDERLAFLLIDPIHYDQERGVIVPEAFQELTKRDLSVLRCEKATKNEATATRETLVARGRAKVPPKERLISEVCKCKVAEIRAARHADARLFAVYDTALPDCKGHASVFTSSAVLGDGRLRKVARQKVHELFTKQQTSFEELVAELPS